MRRPKRRGRCRIGGRLLTLSLCLCLAVWYLLILTLSFRHHSAVPAQSSGPHGSGTSNDLPSRINSVPDSSAVAVLHQPLPAHAKIVRLTPPGNDRLDDCETTIVTGYFPIKSKYPTSEYMKWMQYLLSIQDCMVIYAPQSLAANITALRQHALRKTVLIHMDITDLPIANLRALSSSTSSSFWSHQLDLDFERRRHKSFQLFWIWLSKSWCVIQAMAQDFFHSNIFLWQDIGSFRRRSWWTGKRIVQHAEIIPRGTLLWMAHHPPNPPPTGPLWNDKRNEFQYYFHSGSQAAGSKEAWFQFHDRFAETVDLFLQHDMFIGEDQCVLQATCQRVPSLCAYVRHDEVADNKYWGLRYALYHGKNRNNEPFNFYRMPTVGT